MAMLPVQVLCAFATVVACAATPVPDSVIQRGGEESEACSSAEVEVENSDLLDESSLLQRQKVAMKQEQEAGIFGYGGLTKVGTPESKKCGIVKYPAKYVLPFISEREGLEPPVPVGTDQNMDPRLKQLGLDFTGIWWMRGNPIPEELASFAGATVNSSTFPASLVIPDTKGHWTWQENSFTEGAWSRFILWYGQGEQGSVGLKFRFEDATKAEIDNPLEGFPLYVKGFPTQKKNDDEWIRTTTFQNPSIADQTYMLTRIIYADGSPTKFWLDFLQYMASKDGRLGEKSMISMYTNDRCMRKCQGALPCNVCQIRCRLSSQLKKLR